MAYIKIPDDIPGIRGLFAFRPETAKPLKELAENLLRTPSTMSQMDREIIATYVSHLNECTFCTKSHGAIVSYLNDNDTKLIEAVKKDYHSAPIGEKLKKLLAIAEKVQQDARKVSEEDVEAALAEGAMEREIHDTVLIAAAFCMYNKYVDGLGAREWVDQKLYEERARLTAEEGYFSEMD